MFANSYPGFGWVNALISAPQHRVSARAWLSCSALEGLPLAEDTTHWLLNMDPPLPYLSHRTSTALIHIHLPLKAMCSRADRMYPQLQQVTTAESKLVLVVPFSLPMWTWA